MDPCLGSSETKQDMKSAEGNPKGLGAFRALEDPRGSGIVEAHPNPADIPMKTASD